MQGLPVLVGLIEDNVTESGRLTGIGVDCIWRVLEVHGTSPLNHLCRLVANAGLPHRLMRAMLTCNQEYQLLLTHAEVFLGPPNVPWYNTARRCILCQCLLHQTAWYRYMRQGTAPSRPAFASLQTETLHSSSPVLKKRISQKIEVY